MLLPTQSLLATFLFSLNPTISAEMIRRVLPTRHFPAYVLEEGFILEYSRYMNTVYDIVHVCSSLSMTWLSHKSSSIIRVATIEIVRTRALTVC